MAALDFPASPSVNDTYTANGKTWQWDGTTWRIVTSLAAAVPIQTVTASGSTPLVAFANIPQNFENLVIEYDAQISSSGVALVNFFMGFNGDTTAANYTSVQWHDGFGTTSQANVDVAASTGMPIGLIPGTSGLAAAIGTGAIYVRGYRNALFNKIVEAFSCARYTGPANRVRHAMGTWLNVAPVTDILITATSNLTAGSKFTLYGVGGGVPVATMPSSGLVLLASTVAAGSPAALAVSGLSADYTDLVCRVHGRGNGSVAVDDMRLLINGDTTAANYTSSIFIEVSGGSPNGSNNSPTSAGAAVGLSTGVSGNANALATTDFTIFGYKDPLFHKEIHARSFSTNGASAQLSKINTFSWKSLAVVTALSLGAVGSTWADGSTLKVFGRL